MLKGGHVLDALASCHTIAFDKTGTLTTGEFACKAIEPIHGHESNSEKQIASCCLPSCEEEALAVAAALEKGTTHPIGRLFYLSGNICHEIPFSLLNFDLLIVINFIASLYIQTRS